MSCPPVVESGFPRYLPSKSREPRRRRTHAATSKAQDAALWTRRGSAVAPSDCAPTPRPPLQGRVTLCRPFGSPQVCGPCGRIPPTLTRSSERLGHGFSPRFCRRAPKAREASKGGARQAAPVGRGGRGMWVPGSQVSRPSGSLAAGMKSVRPCSRHRLAPRPPCPTTRGMLHTLHFFPTAGEAQLPSLIRRCTSCASPAVGTRNATCAVWLIARRVSVTDGTCVRRGACGCARAGERGTHTTHIHIRTLTFIRSLKPYPKVYNLLYKVKLRSPNGFNL